MGDFHFLRPLWLVALLPSLAIWWGLWQRQDRMAAWRNVIDEHLLPHLLVGNVTPGRLRPVQLLLLLWTIATIAMAGPAWRLEPSPFADDQAGLFVLLKVGETMLASDVQPSRLDRAKHKLRDLLEQRKGASTGLIVYSGSAHLVMPLTRDDRIISAMVEDLTPDLMPEEGDALARALQLAEQLMANSGVTGSALVIADNVSPTQAQELYTTKIELPVQFLSMQPPSADVDSGLRDSATALRATVTRLTVDQTDVEQAARRAQSKPKNVSTANEGTRWLDDGYTLLPLLAFFALMWSRKGWVVR